MKNFSSILLFVGLALATSTSRASVFVGSFPDGSETRSTLIGLRFWNLGDFIEQSFVNTGLSFVESINLDLNTSPNSLSGDTQDMDVIINGITVGSFSISPGDSVVPISITGFNVAAIGVDDFLLRLETTRTVTAFAGSAGIVAGSNNLELANSVPEPSSMAVWSLLGLVVGGIGWYRRKRQAA